MKVYYEAFDGRKFQNELLCKIYEDCKRNHDDFFHAGFCAKNLRSLRPWEEDFWENIYFMNLPNKEFGMIVKDWFKQRGAYRCRRQQ